MNPDRKSLSQLVVTLSATLRDVLTSLDATGAGTVFVVEGDNLLKGIMTDGDVRRALLGGAQITDPLAAHLSPRFTAGRADASRNDNLALMSRRILHLPLVDAEGRLVDYISWKDLWSVPLVSPSLSGNEMRYVEDCIATGWISSQGAYIRRFEEAGREFIGVSHALAVSNGTLALQLALQALGVGHGDEVIVPDFTFGASANAVVQRGATPVFVDIDPVTWTMDPAAAEAAIGPNTKAIMPVHIYGQPCDMDPILDVAARHGLKVVEDCAEALGATYKGRQVGSLGDVGCFSFFANKIITTGEGGMVTANDPDLARRLTMLRDHGMLPERRYWHMEAGTNCRMTNLQAALGVAQMERVAQFLTWRDALAEHYAEELAGVPGLTVHGQGSTRNDVRKVCWLFSLTVDPDVYGMDRDELMARLKEQGIDSRPVFPPLRDQPAFVGRRAPGRFDHSDLVSARGLSLPTGNDTPIIEVLRVAELIRSLAKRRP